MYQMNILDILNDDVAINGRRQLARVSATIGVCPRIGWMPYLICLKLRLRDWFATMVIACLCVFSMMTMLP